MSRTDPVRLSRAMTFLLQQSGPGTPMDPDEDGWVALDDLCAAVSELLEARVVARDVAELVVGARVARFEIAETRIRAVGRGGRPRAPSMPDILYHATSARLAEAARRAGVLKSPLGKPLFLSEHESSAWRAAHRSGVPDPIVLYVDASRARRRGVRFRKNRRGGLYSVPSLAVGHVLNLQRDFAHQLSAGGVPARIDPDGEVRVALIRVTRRSGVTWEVAKGKMEPGEVPERAAVREVQEEMGVDCDLEVVHHLGDIRYGFVAPGGLHRLKTVYLYLMRPVGDMSCFSPSSREGIGEVAWFTPEEAARAVTHTSLIPQILEVRRLLSAPERVRELLAAPVAEARSRYLAGWGGGGPR